MSEPTKVKESAHTPGPWAILDSTPTEVRLSYGFMGNNLVLAHIFDGPAFGSMEANARRIVACVNYCEGVSTVEIEAAPASTKLQAVLRMIDGDLPRFTAERDRLRERVAELTDALVNLLSAAEQMRHGGYRDPLVASYDGHAYEARTILAKERP